MKKLKRTEENMNHEWGYLHICQILSFIFAVLNFVLICDHCLLSVLRYVSKFVYIVNFYFIGQKPFAYRQLNIYQVFYKMTDSFPSGSFKVFVNNNSYERMKTVPKHSVHKTLVKFYVYVVTHIHTTHVHTHVCLSLHV